MDDVFLVGLVAIMEKCIVSPLYPPYTYYAREEIFDERLENFLNIYQNCVFWRFFVFFLPKNSVSPYYSAGF